MKQLLCSSTHGGTLAYQWALLGVKLWRNSTSADWPIMMLLLKVSLIFDGWNINDHQQGKEESMQCRSMECWGVVKILLVFVFFFGCHWAPSPRVTAEINSDWAATGSAQQGALVHYVDSTVKFFRHTCEHVYRYYRSTVLGGTYI